MGQGASNDRDPQSLKLRLGRFSEPFACYAITKCVENRRRVLAAPQPAELICSSLDYMRRSGDIRILAFCIMPDHYHLLAFLVSKKPLSEVMSSVGKFTGLRLNRVLGSHGRFWQEGYFDHRCRDEDEIEESMGYIEHNPVRATLVERASQWPYSSAHPLQERLLDRDWYAKVR
jgi:putative transposase